MARMGEPIEVASAIIFLLSDESSFITGHVLHVSGGLTYKTINRRNEMKKY